MGTINTFLFYMFFCSSVLVYGVGMLTVSEAAISKKRVVLILIKSYSCVIASVTLTFLIKKHLLLTLNLTELYPLVAVLILVSLCVFFEIIIQLTLKRTVAEFAFLYLAVLLALSEGTTLADSIVISAVALASYYFLILVLRSLNHRISLLKNMDSFQKKICVFFTMIILLFALYSLNISWINVNFGE